MPILSSVTYKGITTTFTNPVDIAYFANGLPCIQNAPGANSVSIASVSPNTIENSDSSGGMINPSPMSDHGFGSLYNWTGVQTYNPAVNVNLGTFPLLLSEGDVYMTSAPTPLGLPFGESGRVKTIMTWHVYGGALPTDAFAPCPYGDASLRSGPLRTYADLNLALLPKKALMGTTLPDKSTFNANLSGLQFCEQNPFFIASIIGTDNMSCPQYPGHDNSYSLHYAVARNSMAAWLMYNNSDADQKAVLIELVQHGLDFLCYLRLGAFKWPDGGQAIGRLIGTYLAAVLFEDSELKSILATKRADNGYSHPIPDCDQCFIVGPEHVGMFDYLEEDIGCPSFLKNGTPLSLASSTGYGWYGWGGGTLQSYKGRRIPPTNTGTGYRLNCWGPSLGAWAVIRLMDPAAISAIPFLLYGEYHYIVSGSPTGNFIDDLISNHVITLGDLSPIPATFNVSGVPIESGTYLNPGTLISSSTTSIGADRHYIFIPDGDPDANPTASDAEWLTDFEVTESGTLKIILIETGFPIEPVTSLSFIVSALAVPPVNQSITIS